MADLNHNILDGLSEKQKEAVTHPLKPLLIIAGPGSGKLESCLIESHG